MLNIPDTSRDPAKVRGTSGISFSSGTSSVVSWTVFGVFGVTLKSPDPLTWSQVSESLFTIVQF